MTLDELIDRLTELREDYDLPGDTLIKGAFQPNYPLIATIGAVTTLLAEEGTGEVYIALNDARDYGSRHLWDDEVIDAPEGDDDEDEDEDEDED